MTHRYALAFVFVTALLDSIGFGIILPVMPELIMDVTDGGLTDAARVGGWLMMVYALMQFFFAPVMGNLSDRFGRRPVLLISLAVLAVDYLIMSWAPTLAWLFVGRLIAGVAASTYSTCNAFIADVSPPDKRAQNFGLMGAAFGVGFIVGPVIGGILGEYGPRVPFLAAALLTLANFCYGLLVLPETLPAAERRPFRWARANPTGTVMALRGYPVVFGLLGAVFLFQLGHQVLPTVWAFFAMEKFTWSPREVGYSLGVVGVTMVLVQAFLLRWVLPRTGPRRAAVLGYGFAVLSLLGYALVPQGWMLYPFLVIGALQGFVGPATNGIMSGQVPANAQGELQGGLSSVASLTAIVGPPLMTQLFAAFTAIDAPMYLPGAPFLAAALLTLLAFALFVRATVGVAAQSVPQPD